jgi:hypothetical protein
LSPSQAWLARVFRQSCAQYLRLKRHDTGFSRNLSDIRRLDTQNPYAALLEAGKESAVIRSNINHKGVALNSKIAK